jgi:hypothetical protein
MESTIMKRTISPIAADLPYCPVPTLPWLTRSATTHDGGVGEHEHSSEKGVTSENRNGKKSIMTVVIGVKESMNDSEMADLLRSLRSNSGITSVRQSRTNHFLLVEYDPNLSQRRDILDHLGDRGLHACVASC